MAYTATQIQRFPLRKVSSLGSGMCNQNEHAFSVERTWIARETQEDYNSEPEECRKKRKGLGWWDGAWGPEFRYTHCLRTNAIPVWGILRQKHSWNSLTKSLCSRFSETLSPKLRGNTSRKIADVDISHSQTQRHKSPATHAYAYTHVHTWTHAHRHTHTNTCTCVHMQKKKRKTAGLLTGFFPSSSNADLWNANATVPNHKAF